MILVCLETYILGKQFLVDRLQFGDLFVFVLQQKFVTLHTILQFCDNPAVGALLPV